MALCTLIQSYPRNHLHLLLSRPFGKRNPGIWRNFLLFTADFDSRCCFSTKSCLWLPKTFTSWNKSNFSCSYLTPLGRRFNKNELGFHSSSTLLYIQGDPEANNSGEDVKINQARTESISVSNEDLNEQQCETFDEQNQADGFAKDPLGNESLMNCGTLEEHAALLQSSKHSFERNLAGKEECHGLSLQKTVQLTLGW